MPTEIKMPALSPTMEEGKLAKWLVKEGDEVVSGDILAEIETDKATMEFEAVDEGVILSIAVPEGTEGVKVGTVIATLTGEDEDEDAAEVAAPEPAKQEPVKEAASTPEAKPEAQAKAAPMPVARSSNEGRVIASPLAKRLAAERGHVLAMQQHPPARRRFEPHQRARKRGLAAAAFADQRQSLAPAQVQVHRLHRAHRTSALAGIEQVEIDRAENGSGVRHSEAPSAWRRRPGPDRHAGSGCCGPVRSGA